MLMIRPYWFGIIESLPICCDSRKMAEIHQPVPRLQAVFSSRCAPSRAGVVDQNVNLAELRDCLCGKALDVRILRVVRGNPFRPNTKAFQVLPGSFQFVLVSGGQHQASATLAQNLRDLEAEASRSAGDEHRPPREVESLENTCHRSAPEAADCHPF